MKSFRFTPVAFVLALYLFFLVPPLSADIVTFNSLNHANVATYRANWLTAIGISAPEYLVDFETGFTHGQNITGVTGLFPMGLVITDTSGSNPVTIVGTPYKIDGSNPVNDFAIKHNEEPYLELIFATPVDYLAFRDIDQAGTIGIVTFVGGDTASISFETTNTGGDSAEFFGIYRNDKPRITKVQLDASGGGGWGLDNIEYGRTPVPIPGAVWLLGSGLLGLIGLRRKFLG